MLSCYIVRKTKYNCVMLMTIAQDDTPKSKEIVKRQIVISSSTKRFVNLYKLADSARSVVNRLEWRKTQMRILKNKGKYYVRIAEITKSNCCIHTKIR